MRFFYTFTCSLVCVVLAGCGTSKPYTATVSGQPSAVVRLSNDQADSIAIHALGLVGTPYRYGGNNPDAGFDCSGLIGYVYSRQEQGYTPPRTVAQLHTWGQVIEENMARTGDLVLFGSGRTPTHAGIYVGNGRFVHAPSSGGTVRLDSINSRHWASQNPSFRRL
jgi:cell wall-associated NlpC family hydrolase